MIYYDRRLLDAMLALLCGGGALGWMSDFLHSPQGADALSHVQFRRDRRSRRLSGIQIYFGRTSPLEIRGAARGCVRLCADTRYKALSPAMFRNAYPVVSLSHLEGEFRAHLERARLKTDRCFLEGEAVAHAGLLRRYGISYSQGDPLVVVDSEARVGFSSESERNAFEDRQRRRLPLRDGEELPRKLDTLAVLSGGNLALVEIKDEGESMRRAAIQAAAHVAAFEELRTTGRGALAATVREMLAQKASAGLVGSDYPRLDDDAPIIPVIAAPDDRRDWSRAWTEEVDATQRESGGLLDRLRFWRLSATGEFLEEHTT